MKLRLIENISEDEDGGEARQQSKHQAFYFYISLVSLAPYRRAHFILLNFLFLTILLCIHKLIKMQIIDEAILTLFYLCENLLLTPRRRITLSKDAIPMYEVPFQHKVFAIARAHHIQFRELLPANFALDHAWFNGVGAVGACFPNDFLKLH